MANQLFSDAKTAAPQQVKFIRDGGRLKKNGSAAGLVGKQNPLIARCETV